MAIAEGVRPSAGAGDGKVAFRGGGFAPRTLRHAGPLTLILLVLLWQAVSAAGLVNDLTLPSPIEICRALSDLARSGDLLVDVEASLRRLLIGWSLGAAAGILAGLLIGISSIARSVGIPVVAALFPIPKIAMLPLFILWFGIGEPSKVATIALGAFFPTAINAYAGVDAVPRTLVRMAQSFGLGPLAIIWKIILPGAFPGILAGVRISSSIALVLLVAAEMIGAEHGVGAMILQAGNLMRTDRLMAGVVLLSLFGLLVSWLVSRLERRVVRWR
jgi:NitT/TauT family transport system permease protein